jgi:acyl carrier protein
MSNNMKKTPSSRTDTEERLAALWRDVLKTDAIGPDDVFIDLGGDSLAAMLCISEIRRSFGVELTIEDFFYDQATISGLALIIERERGQKDA